MTLDDLSVASATSKFLPQRQQSQVEEYASERLFEKIHERQDTLDVRLHKEETLAGDEKLKRQWRRETGNSFPSSKEDARKKYYLFENWRADRLFKALCPIYGGCKIPKTEFYRLAYDRKDQEAIDLLADSFGVPRVKVSYGKFVDDVGQTGEYIVGEQRIVFRFSPQSPYFLTHEFFHYLIDVSPRVKMAEREAVAFLEELQ
jgi:hypothetical protein